MKDNYSFNVQDTIRRITCHFKNIEDFNLFCERNKVNLTPNTESYDWITKKITYSGGSPVDVPSGTEQMTAHYGETVTSFESVTGVTWQLFYEWLQDLRHCNQKNLLRYQQKT